MQCKQLFKPGVAFPRDHTGFYVDLSGTIIEIGERLSTCIPLIVKTNKGKYKGYYFIPPSWKDKPINISVNDLATIRIYDLGGGYYPNDTIINITKASS